MSAVNFAKEVRKALVAVAAVAATIQVTSGVPTDVKAYAAELAALLTVFGITWKVKNEPQE